MIPQKKIFLHLVEWTDRKLAVNTDQRLQPFVLTDLLSIYFILSDETQNEWSNTKSWVS